MDDKGDLAGAHDALEYKRVQKGWVFIFIVFKMHLCYICFDCFFRINKHKLIKVMALSPLQRYKNRKFLHAYSKDSDETRQIYRWFESSLCVHGKFEVVS